ncbi:MAG: ferritin family protein [Roseateles sp.]|uniref:iron exporter MbfA n=1 Tax=Roseateles sp. TaxID=1971397 RepID=UPI0039E9634C
MRDFDELSEREILALAISSEEEDGRIYLDFAEGLRADYPATAGIFTAMAAEEDQHRRWLIDQYRRKFGEHIPLITRAHVRGFYRRRPIWQMLPLNLAAVRRQAEEMEYNSARFYRCATARATDASIRTLLGDLATAERKHEDLAEHLTEKALAGPEQAREAETARRILLLRFIQPGLAGLMDGSVSTLAPVFAAAFATGRPWDAFVVGMAASIGAGISMGFAEALSDNGSLTGRGAPLIRGVVCGLMTTLGGIGHTLPFLIPDFWTAMAVAVGVVVVELAVISWVRWKYMETPPLSAALQVGFGGALVFATGVLIGSS